MQDILSAPPQSGLLRSLCFDIFRHCPDIMPTVLASGWSALPALASLDAEPSTSVSWSQSELSDIIKRACATDLLSEAQNVYSCFFIDRLDQYDGSADDLLDTLRSLCGSRNVKLCVSSRP